MATTGTIKVTSPHPPFSDLFSDLSACPPPTPSLSGPPPTVTIKQASKQLPGTACLGFLCAALSSPNFPPTHSRRLLLPAFTSSRKLLVSDCRDLGLLCQRLALTLILRGLVVLPSSPSFTAPPRAPHPEHGSSHMDHTFLAASSSPVSAQGGLELEAVLL